MTSLKELCRTDQEREIASKLAEIEILTDRDLLLADDSAFKRCNVSKNVPKILGKCLIQNVDD